jgi:hypothetical protein
VICGLICGFTGRGSERLLDCGAPVLTVAAPCIWHGCGTNLSRRQSATMAGAPTNHARVCLAAPPPASATLLVSSTGASGEGRPVVTVSDSLTWEPAINSAAGEDSLGYMRDH